MLAAALTAHPGGSFRSERAVSRAGSARGATTIDEPIPWIPKLDRHLCAGTALLAGRFGHQAVDGLALPRLTRVTTERSADRACRAPRSLRNGPRARLTRSAARHREAARRDPLPKCAAKRPPNPNCRAHASSGGRVRSSRESPRAAPACASAREVFHRAGSESVADPLQQGGVLAVGEPVVPAGVADAEPFALPLRPAVPIQPDTPATGVGDGLPKRPASVRVHNEK